MHVLTAVLHGDQCFAQPAVNAVVLKQYLRVAQNAVERRAQLVRHAHHISRLGQAG